MWPIEIKEDTVMEGKWQRVSRVCDNLGQSINQLLIHPTHTKHSSCVWDGTRLREDKDEETKPHSSSAECALETGPWVLLPGTHSTVLIRWRDLRWSCSCQGVTGAQGETSFEKICGDRAGVALLVGELSGQLKGHGSGPCQGTCQGCVWFRVRAPTGGRQPLMFLSDWHFSLYLPLSISAIWKKYIYIFPEKKMHIYF